MIKRVQVSAPGKCILMGEHSVVYGQAALVAAVSLRLRVAMERQPGAALAIDIPQLGLSGELAWDAVLAYAEEARRRWLCYQADPSPEAFASLRGSDRDHLLKVALGEGVAFLQQKESWPAGGMGLRLRVVSDLPLGAGFGSSAAAAAALIAGLLEMAGQPPDLAELEALALDAERRQHGQPSGVDTATVLRGGVLRAEKASGELRLSPLGPRSPALAKFRLYNSGSPAESTGAVVSEVRARGERNPSRFQALLQTMGRATDTFDQALRQAREEVETILRCLRDFQRCLEDLGVVPTAVVQKVRAIEAVGGAAKISGAGSLSGPGAGSLLVYHPEPEHLVGVEALVGLERLAVTLGGEGLRRD